MVFARRRLKVHLCDQQPPRDFAEGNIDLVGDIAFADFLVLAENFGKTRADASAVPEPSGLILFAIGALLLGGFRRRAEDLCSGSV